MRKKSFLIPAIIVITLVIGQQTWGLELEGGGDTPRLQHHGYAELHYNSPAGGDAQLDMHRIVYGFSYDLSDSIISHVAIDFEHAVTELELEYAYLDFLIDPTINARAGVILVPVGPLNEFSEPTLFYSVERAGIQNVIIPTTWQEGGVGIFGTLMEGLSYRLYLVGGLVAEEMRAEDGLRKGRSKVSGGGKNRQKAGEKLAVVGRLEYAPTAGLDLGLSLYEGGVDQKNKVEGASPSVRIFEIDGRIRMAGIDFQSVYAKVEVDDSDKINATFKRDLGKEMLGWYIELAYHMSYAMGTSWDLVPFVRISEYNTHNKVAAPLTADPKLDKKVSTYGLAFYPHPQVVLKVDVQNTKDAKGGERDQFNLGVAWTY